MSKDKSFAAKIAKAAGAMSSHCPECGEVISPLFVVESYIDDKKGSTKFNEKFVGICNCNKDQVMS